MTIVKLISLFILSSFLIACGNEQAPASELKGAPEKISSDLFETQKKALDDARNIEKVLVDEEQNRKNKLKELGL